MGGGGGTDTEISQPRKLTLERKLLPPLLPFHYGLVTGADNTNPFTIALLQMQTTCDKPFHYSLVTGADNTNPFTIALL